MPELRPAVLISRSWTTRRRAVFGPRTAGPPAPATPPPTTAAIRRCSRGHCRSWRTHRTRSRPPPETPTPSTAGGPRTSASTSTRSSRSRPLAVGHAGSSTRGPTVAGGSTSARIPWARATHTGENLEQKPGQGENHRGRGEDREAVRTQRGNDVFRRHGVGRRSIAREHRVRVARTGSLRDDLSSTLAICEQ